MGRLSAESVRKMVQRRYGSLAVANASGCGEETNSTCCVPPEVEKSSSTIDFGYTQEQLEEVPAGANMGLGCGNPLNIAKLQPGETVLDLGSGAGFDCFLASRKVGPSGRVIGVDMTAEMVEKANFNKKRGDFPNVEFRYGNIEQLPIDDSSVDVIISNCVINLSPQKEKVFQEALRVLKPGGRLTITDMVALRDLPLEIKENPELLCSCVGGAETPDTIKSILIDLGFDQLEISLCNYNTKNFVASAFIEAIKPLS